MSINNNFRLTRKLMSEKSIKIFAENYFSNYLKQPMCQFHKDLYGTLLDISKSRNEKIAIAAPRNSAKSSIVSAIYVLWLICFKKEKFIVLISDNNDKASEMLDSIKRELEENDKLLNDFPEVMAKKEKRRHRAWKKSSIDTANGVKVIALGSQQKIRGRKNRDQRPTLIILDDVENEENTFTKESRDKLFSWFTKSVLKAGSKRTNVIVIGTILHYDSLLFRLVNKNKMYGWKADTYESVINWADNQDLWQKWSQIFQFRSGYKGKRGKEAAALFFKNNKKDMLKGTEVFWPERESYYDLMVMREEEGEASFDSEKQNNPVNLKNCPFNPNKFCYWDDQYPSEKELFGDLQDNLKIYGACDPAMGNSTYRGDYSAFVSIAKDSKTGIIYVLDSSIERQKPDQLIETIINFCDLRNYGEIAVESNGFQELMRGALGDRALAKGVNCPTKGLKNNSHKSTRFFSLQPLINSGKVRFSRKHTKLIEQLRYFPKGRHDDGIDALEMAVRISRKPSVSWYVLGADDDDD